MRIGVIGSSGGSVFNEVFRILNSLRQGHYYFSVVTDRACGLEDMCLANSIKCRRIESQDNRQFSVDAGRFFKEGGGVDVILLFFARLITKELFEVYPTFNIHPSLLPAFRGFNPIKKALKEKVKFFGATLHLVDASVDGGPIMAQISLPLDSRYTEDQVQKISFIQKVYLSLLLIELLETEGIKMLDGNSGFVQTRDMPYTDRCNPAIEDIRFLQAVYELQAREEVEALA